MCSGNDCGEGIEACVQKYFLYLDVTRRSTLHNIVILLDHN